MLCRIAMNGVAIPKPKQAFADRLRRGNPTPSRAR
jgi:hypothetical protein